MPVVVAAATRHDKCRQANIQSAYPRRSQRSANRVAESANLPKKGAVVTGSARNFAKIFARLRAQTLLQPPDPRLFSTIPTTCIAKAMEFCPILYNFQWGQRQCI